VGRGVTGRSATGRGVTGRGVTGKGQWAGDERGLEGMGKARIGGPHLLQGARQVITAIFRLSTGQASEGVCEICKMTD